MLYYLPKKTQLLGLILLLGCGMTTRASDFVTITAPAENSTVIGVPLSIAGTSSKPGFLVRLTINTTEIGSPTTDVNGNWSFASNDINNGQYTITAELLDGNSVVIATDTNSFTIQNPPTIFILSPADQDIVSNPLTVYGVSGLAFATVNLLIDNSIVATTTTDASGNWSTFFNLTSNGVHTLRANLIQTASTVASHTISITASSVINLGVAEFIRTIQSPNNSVAPGTAFTIDTQVFNTIASSVTASAGAGGTVYTLTAGTYLFDYEMSLESAGSIGIYTGATAASLVLDATTAAGSTTAATWIHGKAVVQVATTLVAAISPVIGTAVVATAGSAAQFMIRLVIVKTA